MEYDAAALFSQLRAWLAWATTRPEIQALLDEHAAVTPSGHVLAHWLAEHFAGTPQ